MADAFGFIADCLEMGVEAACDANNRGRFEKLVLCYFSPDAARTLQTAAPQAYLDRIGSNINNVAQYMYRENRKDFEKVLQEIQSKLPGIEKIEPQKFENGFSKQLFVTTHSPFFVNALGPDDVWVLAKNSDGYSSIKRASDYAFVKEWKPGC